MKNVATNIAVAILGIALAGCVPSSPQLDTSLFVASETAFIRKDGPNTITGQAFLRRRDGVVVYGAGETAYLVPHTAYSQARLDMMFGNPGYNIVSPYSIPKFEYTPAEYEENTRTVIADGEGRFTFAKVPDGTYYITIMVVWMPGKILAGGLLRTLVKVSGGETKNVMLNGN